MGRAARSPFVTGRAGGVSPSQCISPNLRSFVFFMQVIAAAGSDDKCELAMQRGAQASVNYSRRGLKEAVRELTGSSGVNVVVDTVGGDIFLEALRRCSHSLSRAGWAWGSAETAPALSAFWPGFSSLFAAHFSCRLWHQREQLSGWVERTRSRKCLNIAKNQTSNWKIPKK